MDDILSSDLDLYVPNDVFPTYFQFNSENSEIVDLMLCSSLMTNTISHFEVLSDHRMGSNHVTILCTLRVQKRVKSWAYCSKANWNKYGKILDEIIDQVDSEHISELNEIFNSLIINSAEKYRRGVKKDKKSPKESKKSKDPQY